MQSYSFKILKVLVISLFIQSIIGLTSCDVIFVEDISESTVELIAPQNNCVSESKSITFWWKNIEDAQKYSLQIVRPSFDSPTKLIVDTLVVKTNYTLTLENGIYEWRVAGVNNISKTQYSTYRFTISSN